LRTDEASAAVVFATLNTTRARLDLIQRLANIRISDKALSKNLTAIIERFSESTKVRNELNHCMSFLIPRRHHPNAVDAIDGNKVEPEVRRDKGTGQSRQQKMLETTHEMTKINREIWDLRPRLEAHVCGAQPLETVRR
jgi:hypothetical protein